MKTKIFTLGVLLLPFSCLFSQTLKVNKVEELKTYALFYCLRTNYNSIDSTFQSRDITGAFIVGDLVSLPLEQLNKLNSFVEKETSSYFKPILYQEFSTKDANSICYDCVEFYKSKELTKFIKKLLKQIK